MKLIDRQIEAVKETLEQVIGEYERGKIQHFWDISICILCEKFYYPPNNKCKECPIPLLVDTHNQQCWDWKEESPSLEDIAGFLKSLLISLEEMR